MTKHLKGGELIGQGSYGCVFKPGLKCNGELAGNDKISKLMIKKEALKEINELKKIDIIDKDFIFHIETPRLCDISINDYINEPGIDRCNLIKDISKLSKLSKLVNLEYNYGGITIKELLERRLINNEFLIKAYFTKFENMFYGLYQMNKNNFMHNDIKNVNIVIHPSNLDIKYIDFGLSRSINKELTDFENHIYKYGYFAYPFETFLLDKEVFNHYKYGSSKNIDVFNSMRVNYELGYGPHINKKYMSGSYKLYENTWLNDKREYIEIIKNTSYENFKNELLGKLDIFSLGLILMESYYYIFNEKIDLTKINSKKDNLLKYHLLELIKAMTNSFYKERVSAKHALRYYRENIIPLVSDIQMRESSRRESSRRESSMKEPSRRESSIKEPSIKEPSRRKTLRRESSRRESSMKEPSRRESLRRESLRRESSKTLKKRCPDGKILNPKTNRCVNKSGKTGQKVIRYLKKGISPSKTLKKRCPEGKILNPKTNRCVNKTGKIGKKILHQYKFT
jgi:serine/threonine protein kinase